MKSAPLRAHSSSPDVDSGEKVEVEEKSVTSAPTSTHEEEQFEWMEVKRGNTCVYLTAALVIIFLGILDIQTWITGIAYFSLVVSLYSFSLFLQVSPAA